MASISSIPPEVLEIVFQYLDGCSFIRCSRVCKKWFEVSRHVDKVFWRRTCLSEVDKEILEELCGLCSTSDICDNEVWKCAYAKWARTTLVKSYRHWIKHFSWSQPADVTCIKYSGAWIVTGHQDGKVCTWDPLKGKNNVIVQHLKFISDLALLDLVKAGQYGYTENPWDHHHLISVSADFAVKLSYLLLDNAYDSLNSEVIHIYSSRLKNVRVFGEKAVISAANNHYLIFSLEVRKNPLFCVNMILLTDVIGPEEELECFTFWHGLIFGVCLCGHSGSYSVKTQIWGMDNISCITSKFTSSHGNWKHALMPYVFRSGIVFLPSDLGNLFICAGSEAQSYKIMQAIKCGINAIGLWGSLLALGTDSGYLLLYHVPKVSDLLSLDIAKPSWSQDLHMGPVMYIEISDDGNSPIVIACSSFKMTVIKWYK